MKHAMDFFKDNRLARRYPTFCTVDLEPGTGVTHNLSTTGVCFTTDKTIELGLVLRCFIIMQKVGGNSRRLRCEGRVIRVEKSAKGWKIAVNFTTLEW